MNMHYSQQTLTLNTHTCAYDTKYIWMFTVGLVAAIFAHSWYMYGKEVVLGGSQWPVVISLFCVLKHGSRWMKEKCDKFPVHFPVVAIMAGLQALSRKAPLMCYTWLNKLRRGDAHVNEHGFRMERNSYRKSKQKVNCAARANQPHPYKDNT